MAASSSSSPSTSVSSSWRFNYDVFLSFRGEDTRKTFVDHLYSALVARQINTYKDDQTLPRGESIGVSLFKAIEQSQIAVVIFSKNYADSSWCLEELTYIMKCKEEKGLIVMPIFYDVDPSDVRKQKGEFGKRFERQEVENSTQVELWRKTLVAASEIAGWEPKNIANGHESEVIKQIVDTIFHRLFSSNSYVDEDLVGIKARLEELKLRLEIASGGVRMVGIWGVGGGGKTTLATSVYSKISHDFECNCIVENIREKSSKYDLEKLQEKILSTVFRTEVKVQSVAEGKHMIRRRLCGRKVLLVLDDVDKLEQLEVLAGSHNWFGSGSRIIITTRDEHLLKTHKVDDVYPIRLLSDEEAIQLLNKHARNDIEPIKDYERLSLRVVSYAGGLPLALKVLGSFLYDKNEKGWISALDRLKDIPEMEIVEKLKISYDGLKKEEKELFLDIACFFRNESTDDAMEILDACGFHAEIGIKVLRQKALLTISEEGEFNMHDLVQEMGHYIVRGKYPNNPENHSRVWSEEEINNICSRDAIKENDKIEAIPYRYHGLSSPFCKFISNMKRLRWLTVVVDDDEDDGRPKSLPSYIFKNMMKLRFIRLLMKDMYDGGPNFLSNELCYLSWENYPAIPFPESFQPMKLVVLKLDHSLQKVLWNGYKCLPRLKVLQLERMNSLLSTPNFDELPCLQKLTLSDCDNLEKIHESLGNHRSLEYVSVSCCCKLRMFPALMQMEKLETLEIMDCSAIIEFPYIHANMESLVNLSLTHNMIEVLPSSIGERCTNLTSLCLFCFNLKSIEFNLGSFKQLKEFTFFAGLRHLQTMPASFEKVFQEFPRSLHKLHLGCSFQDKEIPTDIGELCNLQELDLRWNFFSRLDFSLSQLTWLKHLNLSYCKRLVELPELPSSIAILEANNCSSLTTVGDSHRNCKWLCKVSLVNGGTVSDGGRLLESMLQGKAIEYGPIVLWLEGLDIAKGFTPLLHKGNRCILQLPENWSHDFCGFLMCAITTSNNHWSPPYVYITIEPVMSGDMDSEQRDMMWEECDSDMITGVWYVPFGSLRHTAWWDETYNKLFFHIGHENFTAFGIRLVARKSGRSPRETSAVSSKFSDHTPNLKISINGDSLLLVRLNM